MCSLCCCFYTVGDYLYYLKVRLPERWKPILMDSVLCVHNQLISYTWAKPGRRQERVDVRDDGNTALLNEKGLAMCMNVYQKTYKWSHIQLKKTLNMMQTWQKHLFPYLSFSITAHPLSPSNLLIYWSICQKHSWLYRSLLSLWDDDCALFVMLLCILSKDLNRNYSCTFRIRTLTYANS